jgi:predicted ArsR family transcriptional regulator
MLIIACVPLDVKPFKKGVITMPKGPWTFITAHGAVLALIARHGRITAKEIADTLGMTERPVRRIIAELEATGYLRRHRVGRVNEYRVNEGLSLRRPSMRDTAVRDLIRVLKFQLPEETG